MPEPRIVVESRDAVRVVRLNRPDKKNALDSGMFEGLVQAARLVAADRAIRVVVLSGAGDCFCSGLDLSSFAAMSDAGLCAENVEVASAAAVRSASRADAARHLC